MNKDTKRKYRFLMGTLACFIVVLFAGIGFSVDDYTYENQDEVSENIVIEQPRIKIPKVNNTVKTKP